MFYGFSSPFWHVWKLNQSNLRIFLLKWANPGLFFLYFRILKHTLQFLQQINVKKCPSSIRCQDLNSQPLEHEYPPITTRPGLPPLNVDPINDLKS